MATHINVSPTGLVNIINDLTKGEALGLLELGRGQNIAILNLDDGRFQVSLTKAQVKKLEITDLRQKYGSM